MECLYGWMAQLAASGADKTRYENFLTSHQEFRKVLPDLESVRIGGWYQFNIGMQYF
jgi:hypothetical protein